MKSTLVIVALVVVLIVTLYINLGDTIASRQRVSERTKVLATKVLFDPDPDRSRAAMNELIGILDSNWTFGRCQACYALDGLGPLAASAVPHLMKAAQSGKMFISQDAVRGLRSIGPPAAPAVDMLTGIVDDALSHENASLRAIYAVEALGNIGEKAVSAIPLLERATHSSDGDFASEAEQAIAKLRANKKNPRKEGTEERKGAGADAPTTPILTVSSSP